MPEWAWPSSGIVYLFKNLMRFIGIMLIKNIKQTYKSGLHFTVICCMNKCIVNECYIPQHQNKLNIYDLQNYDFFSTEKKFVKFVKF